MDNPLVSTVKSTSGLQVVLHPLVLLTVSDYITRHAMRNQSGPIACGLIGQTHGREITIEHAFECQTTHDTESGDVTLSADWFTSRLDQMTQVHKDRQLDLVGWATVLPQSGPEPFILPIHQQVLSFFNESAVLLAIHPELIGYRSAGGNLPLTIYESHYEVEGANQQDGEDMAMKDSGDPATSGSLKLKFSELPYTVETGEAEMISMDTVAKTATAASRISEDATQKPSEPKPSNSATKAVTVDKGKRRIIADRSKPTEIALSREEDEMIAALTAKANAIKMLHGRLKVLIAYLNRLPPEFVSGEEIGTITEAMKQIPDNGYATVPDYNVLRSIQALVNRLPLIVPNDEVAFNNEVQRETNDVKLIGLIRDVISQTVMAKHIGRKAYITEQGRIKTRGAISFMDPQAAASQPIAAMSAGDLM